jgi:hypothetical protein
MSFRVCEVCSDPAFGAKSHYSRLVLGLQTEPRSRRPDPQHFGHVGDPYEFDRALGEDNRAHRLVYFQIEMGWVGKCVRH